MIKDAIVQYIKRIGYYIAFDYQHVVMPSRMRNLPPDQYRNAEANLLLKQLIAGDTVVLLDEKGSQMRSRAFASWINNFTITGVKRLVFVIGGAYGVDQSLIERAVFRLSLSEMTLPHQLARLLFVEQLYRAFTILRNEPYHNE